MKEKSDFAASRCCSYTQVYEAVMICMITSLSKKAVGKYFMNLAWRPKKSSTSSGLSMKSFNYVRQERAIFVSL